MPATPNEIERHYTQPPDDDGDGMCPVCEGRGSLGPGYPYLAWDKIDCEHCNGTGTISAERAAEDAAEDWGDQQMEMARDRAIENATGFEE